MKNYKIPEGSVCKPCWELRYCPFGCLVERSPIVNHHTEVEEIKRIRKELVDKFLNGQIETEEELILEIDRFLYLDVELFEYFSQYDPKEICCKEWGHVCPVFVYQSGATETKESRREGRYVPRDLMFKVSRRDNYQCQICHKNVPDKEIEFDHIIPVTKGGPTSVENIRLLCRSCNRKKSDSMEELLKE